MIFKTSDTCEVFAFMLSGSYSYIGLAYHSFYNNSKGGNDVL